MEKRASFTLFEGIFDGIQTPAPVFMNERKPSEPESYFSLTSSFSSTTKKESQVHIPPRVTRALHAQGFETDNHGIVQWQIDSTAHPRRWSISRKVFDSAVICLMQSFMTMVSNFGSAMAPHAAAEFGISTDLADFLFTTLYLIGQAFGGLVLPPVSENFGGKTIYVSSTLLFAIFSFIMAAKPIVPVIAVFRVLTGFISAMPAVVAAGTFENMWDIRAMAFTIHLWTAVSIVGLATSPAIATFICTSPLHWTWLFFLCGYVAAGILLLTVWMRESRPSLIMQKQVKKIARETAYDGLLLAGECARPTFANFAKTSLVLPVRLFFTEPIITLTSILAATACGLVYLFSNALSVVYIEHYHFTARQTSLTNLAMCIGVVFSALPRLVDARIMKLRRRQMRPLEPEDKLFGFQVATPVLAVGLWWFALTVPPMMQGISPWASIAAMALIGFSAVEYGALLSGYLCDSYSSFAASANAPMAFIRATLSGCFPLFGRQFFTGLGANHATFILASLATLYCAVPVLFTCYGKQLRQRSRFATQLEAHEQEVAVPVIVETPAAVGVTSSEAALISEDVSPA